MLKPVWGFLKGIGGLLLLALIAVGAVISAVFRPRNERARGRTERDYETTADDIRLADEARRDARAQGEAAIERAEREKQDAKDTNMADRVNRWNRRVRK